MLPVYLEVPREAKKIINKNVGYMFELLKCTCEGLSYADVLDSIYPSYILDIKLEKCVQMIKELYNMTQDNYERETLAPFYEWTLFHTISWWLDVTDENDLDEIPRKYCTDKSGEDRYNYINNVKNYIEFLFLMDGKQLKVKKIVVYSSLAYYKKFVYVETSPEEATGLYEEMAQEQIDYWGEQIGSYYEEYAIFNGHLITRTEYDDGAAVIDGKVIDIENQACIRTRYLTPYNFIICAKWNPLNEAKYDSDVQKILYGILKGTNTIYDLVDYTEKLSRHKMDS